MAHPIKALQFACSQATFPSADIAAEVTSLLHSVHEALSELNEDVLEDLFSEEVTELADQLNKDTLEAINSASEASDDAEIEAVMSVEEEAQDVDIMENSDEDDD